MNLAITYAILALIATAANVLAQWLVLRVYTGGSDLVVSLAAGTAIGLVVKYVLDKRYIFGFRASGLLHDGQTFAVYTVMGLATTLIFWAFEFAFDAVFANTAMRLFGGVVGLAIGYFTKYQLDKRFVFRTRAP
jgi:putative flippase GtrA